MGPTFSSLTATDKIVQKFPDVGAIFSKLLPFIYVGAGLLLLVTLIMGGITLMTAAGDANKMKSGYGQLTAGLIGFIIIFVSFFIAQILQIVFDIKFL
jgi:hypothetical protein